MLSDRPNFRRLEVGVAESNGVVRIVAKNLEIAEKIWRKKQRNFVKSPKFRYSL